MREGFSSVASAYVVAVVVTAAAVLVPWLTTPWLGEDLLLFAPLLAAVAVAVWYGGYRPALVAVALSILASDYLFIEPAGSFSIQRVSDSIAIADYLSTCVIIVCFGQAMRVAYRGAAEGRERLRTTLASIGDAVIATDNEGHITAMNGVAESLTGWTSAEAAGQPLHAVFRIVNEHTRKPAENPVQTALMLGGVVGLANHTLLIAKNGGEMPIDDSAAPIRCREGKVVGCVLVFRDVTERRRAEKTSRVLASIVESSEDAIIGKDTNGIITTWNGAAERLFGYSAAEAVGQPIGMLAPADRTDEMPAILARIRQGERVGHFDTVRRAKSGRFVPISLTVSPIKDEEGQVIGASKIARDISERRRAEQAIQEERARLHATLHGIGDGVITTNAEGRVTMINPVAQALTGWGEEATGQPLEKVFRIVNEHTRKSAENPAAKALREGIIVGLANHSILIRKDGTERPIDDSAAPIRGAVGQILGCVLVFRDITDRRKAEEALKEADHRKDEFLATLAHELRNPLAPIRNAVQMLLMKDAPDPDLKWSREVIDRQSRHMARLLDDLLDVSRITHNKLELRKERFALGSVIQSAVETSRPLIDSVGQQLTVTLPPEPVYLDADPVRLSQVLSNLLNNAAKFSKPAARIRLACEREGMDLLVSVKDDGIGIAADTLPRLFDIFSQGQPISDGSQNGVLGIGLSLVKGLVQLHAGRIEARSEGPGKGSEFIVRLPVVVESPGQESAPANDDGGRPIVVERRLLIVDDLKDAADSLAMLLTMMGHKVHTTYDGEEAIVAAEKFKPEVVLLDIGMPKLNGYDVCRRIRQQEWSNGMFVVALTGWGQEHDRRRAKEAGFDYHMVKPVHTAELMNFLGSLPSGQAAR
jgi:PAS domain S-box-containing protein